MNEVPAPRAIAVVFHNLKTSREELEPVLAPAAASAGIEHVRWYRTSDTDPGQDATARAIADGADTVIAVGGDGTVRAVAEGLRGTEVALGLWPQGTGNLLARNIGLPLNSTAIEIALSGKRRAIDLGVVEVSGAEGEKSEHAFTVMAGIGLDAKMIKNTRSDLKKAVGWLAYIDGVARSLPELKPLKLTYRMDDGPTRRMSAHSIMVGNCGTLPGGVLLIPQAKVDDGRLDIVVLRPRGFFGWLKVWNTLTFENGVLRKSKLGRQIIDLTSKDVRDVMYRTAETMTFDVDEPEELQLDGDEFGEVRRARAWVEPGALTVMVAAD